MGIQSDVMVLPQLVELARLSVWIMMVCVNQLTGLVGTTLRHICSGVRGSKPETSQINYSTMSHVSYQHHMSSVKNLCKCFGTGKYSSIARWTSPLFCVQCEVFLRWNVLHFQVLMQELSCLPVDLDIWAIKSCIARGGNCPYLFVFWQYWC
jgi:hypothetical protein